MGGYFMVHLFPVRARGKLDVSERISRLYQLKMSYLLRIIQVFLRENALRSGRFVNVYRKLCHSDRQEWAQYLKR